MTQNLPTMRLTIAFLLFTFLNINALFAQEGITLKPDLQAISSTKNQTAIIEIPLTEVEPFLAYSLKWRGEQEVKVRFSMDKVNWTAWETLKEDEHSEQTEGIVISTLNYTSKNQRFFQIEATENTALSIRLFNPTTSTPQVAQPNTDLSSRSCPCRFPDIMQREQWCPTGNCPSNSSDLSTTIPTHLIIHHSAGTNQANDWAAIVRSIWDFHVNSNGWSDIGYNYLVDPNGVLYEGRGNNILGAHFCGKNGKTMGVCVMGDFTNVAPTTTAKTSLQKLLAWKACDRSLDPVGSALHTASGEVLKNISGHRDGCATACPGDSFYPQLPQIREAVAAYIDSGCDFLAAPSDITATQINETQILVEWSDNSFNETGFVLQRSVRYPNNFTVIDTLSTDVNQYVDNDVAIVERYYYRLYAINEVDNTAFIETEITTDVVGIENIHLNTQTVQISPNPFQQVIQLKIDNELRGAFSLELINITGQRVYAAEYRKFTNTFTESLSAKNLASGVYFLKITHGDYTSSFKIIKE